MKRQREDDKKRQRDFLLEKLQENEGEIGSLIYVIVGICLRPGFLRIRFSDGRRALEWLRASSWSRALSLHYDEVV